MPQTEKNTARTANECGGHLYVNEELTKVEDLLPDLIFLSFAHSNLKLELNLSTKNAVNANIGKLEPKANL